MAFDKIVDSVKLDKCCEAEADAIREKLGSLDELTFDYENEKGFADAIDLIPSGSSDVHYLSKADAVVVENAYISTGNKIASGGTYSVFGWNLSGFIKDDGATYVLSSKRNTSGGGNVRAVFLDSVEIGEAGTSNFDLSTTGGLADITEEYNAAKPWIVIGNRSTSTSTIDLMDGMWLIRLTS